jgi:hypothetical protein
VLADLKRQGFKLGKKAKAVDLVTALRPGNRLVA